MTLDVSTVTRAVTALVDGHESIDAVARLTFEYQLQNNEAYARVCARRGVGTVRTWRDVPHVHVDTFRTQVFCTVPPNTAAAQYRTSGTTGTNLVCTTFRILDYIKNPQCAISSRRFYRRAVRGSLLA